MGCCLTKNKISDSDIPTIQVHLKYINHGPYIQVLGNQHVNLEVIHSNAYSKTVIFNSNNRYNKLCIVLDDAYNGRMPMGPPFKRDEYSVNVDNVDDTNNIQTSLIQRSPNVYNNLSNNLSNNHPTTILDMLKYVNRQNNSKLYS